MAVFGESRNQTAYVESGTAILGQKHPFKIVSQNHPLRTSSTPRTWTSVQRKFGRKHPRKSFLGTIRWGIAYVDVGTMKFRQKLPFLTMAYSILHGAYVCRIEDTCVFSILHTYANHVFSKLREHKDRPKKLTSKLDDFWCRRFETTGKIATTNIESIPYSQIHESYKTRNFESTIGISKLSLKINSCLRLRLADWIMPESH